MHTRWIINGAAILLAFGLPFAPLAKSQNPPPDSPQGAPLPAENAAGAARVSFIHGDVDMQRGDTGETFAASLNTPLTAGDKISTGDASRTEVQLDFANILRLDANSEINIVSLAPQAMQIQLAQGLANYSVLKGSAANAEIDTGNVAIHPLREGRYRISVNPDGETDVTVRDGEADITTPQGNARVRKGDLIAIRGAGQDTQYKISAAPPADEWDNWSKDRDDLILRSQSRQRTNPYYTGAQDLDGNGVWSEVPDYGSVWTPNVGPDWAPYQAGRWVWEPYWGWTWVSYEPWGWAPYHYGRWFVNGGRWAWWPGPVGAGYQPIWAPAYVSFFGFGSGGFGFGLGLGFGFGSVGWLALGPGDYFHPWWGAYRNSFAMVGANNFSNFHGGVAPLRPGAFSNLHDMMANDRVRAGVSSTSAGYFARGGGGTIARGISDSDLRGARMMTANVPVTPTREGLRASNRPASPSAFFGRAASQRFFSTRPGGAPPQSGFNREAPSFGGGQRYAQPGEQSAYRAPQPAYRPPLDMHKPVVSPRGTGEPYRGAPAPVYRGAPTPAYRPSAPPSRGAPAGGGNRGGGSRSSHR